MTKFVGIAHGAAWETLDYLEKVDNIDIIINYDLMLLCLGV